MQSFASEISQPILPGDEHLQYVPAQGVAGYLTNQPVRWRNTDVTPDAIIFRSAQREGGKNIAIMGDAATICLPDRPAEAGKSERAMQNLDFGFMEFASPSAPIERWNWSVASPRSTKLGDSSLQLRPLRRRQKCSW
jgi:hypothetical protein